MSRYSVTLATYDTDTPCVAIVEVEAKNAREANDIALLHTNHEKQEWTDQLGNVVEWNEIEGSSMTVAEGTEKVSG